jgi:hypothetical protein
MLGELGEGRIISTSQTNRNQGGEFTEILLNIIIKSGPFSN